MIASIKEKQSQLENSDSGAHLANWQKGQERITALTDDISDLESKRSKIQDAIKIAREKLEASRNDRQTINESIQAEVIALKNAESELNKALKLITDLENLKEGTTCPTCHGVINRTNFGDVIDHGKSLVQKCRNSIDDKTTTIADKKGIFGKSHL